MAEVISNNGDSSFLRSEAQRLAACVAELRRPPESLCSQRFPGIEESHEKNRGAKNPKPDWNSYSGVLHSVFFGVAVAILLDGICI